MTAILELYWVPLGAGTSIGSRVVRLSGGTYERLMAARRRRAPQPLFHAALIAETDAGRFTIEVTPVPRAGDPAQRGVVGGGAVGSRLLGRARVFRYEVRSWCGGVIPDLPFAIDSPVVLSTDHEDVTRVLGVLPEVPTPVWGRDEHGTGDMWNSNSVVAWTLAHAGLVEGAGRPPRNGRAPGWDAGLEAARRRLRREVPA